MNYLELIANLGTIVSCFDKIEGIIAVDVKDKKWPSSVDIKSLLDCLGKLAASGVITIPASVLKEITTGIASVEAVL